MRLLVWQWGRHGAGPRYAAELVRAFAREPETVALLSLSAGAELLRSGQPPPCALPVRTYTGLPGLAARMLAAPALVAMLLRWLRRERIDVALCAMPAAMDLVMAAALRLTGVPYVVVVHEADLHPGDHFAAQIRLQRWLVRGAAGVFTLSGHVAERLRAQGLPAGCATMRASLPPFDYGAAPPPPRVPGAPLHLLSFGRLLSYKGLDLLAEALELLGPRADLAVRVVGSGPESGDLRRLRALPGVTVENRWVAEDEVAALLGWADALVLSHRESSQSGVAAAAVAARRWVISTRVGGLAEQLADEPRAILCEPTPASIADGIRALIARPPAAAEPSVAASPWPEVARAMLADIGRIAAGERRR